MHDRRKNEKLNVGDKSRHDSFESRQLDMSATCGLDALEASKQALYNVSSTARFRGTTEVVETILEPDPCRLFAKWSSWKCPDSHAFDASHAQFVNAISRICISKLFPLTTPRLAKDATITQPLPFPEISSARCCGRCHCKIVIVDHRLKVQGRAKAV